MTVELLLIFISLLPAGVLAFTNPSFFRELWFDLRLGRIFHYFMLFVFGFVLFHDTLFSLEQISPEVWLKFPLYFIVLAYAAVFAIATNNKEDLEIDKITNVNRPLVRNAVNPRKYLVVASISLIVSLIIAFLTDPVFFAAVFGISLVYYIYSCKPFKIKRFVFLAKLLIGVNSLISALCGYLLAGGKLTEFPLFWLIFILVPVSLMANFIDLKDTAGDRLAGIKTLPVIWGEPTAKLLIALFTFSAYVYVFFYFNSLLIGLVLLLTVSTHIYLIFRKPYQEKPLFLLHNSLFLGLILLLLIRPYIHY
ncbi:MAG: UbiA family prenyltransferase [Bacteroidota bacterium]